MKKIILTLLFAHIGLCAFGQSKSEQNFEVFWQTFRDNYAFFKLKNVNWDSTYRQYRPLITPKTTEKELIAIFTEMVKPLNDGHIAIEKNDEVLFSGKGTRNYFRTEFAGVEAQFWQNVETLLSQNGFTAMKTAGPVLRNNPPFYYAKSNTLGYIRITRFFGNLSGVMGNEKEEKADQTLMLALMDSVLAYVKDCQGVIIDLRSNGGGHSSYELAGKFADQKVLTHYKTTRQAGGYENFGELTPFFVVPSEGTRYLNKIVILTSDRTASAAEDFTLSLYQNPRVTTIGTNTKGMLSDMFSAQLTKNISFTLSNQRYYDTEKQLLEDQGVPVKISIQNTKQELDNQKDSVLTKALEILKG